MVISKSKKYVSLIFFQRKCEDYFPMEMDEVQTMNRFAIITTSLNQLIDFEIRTLKVTEVKI